MNSATATTRFRATLLLFIIGLLLSGITAFPLLTELRALCQIMGLEDAVSAAGHSGLAHTYSQYPWLAYVRIWDQGTTPIGLALLRASASSLLEIIQKAFAGAHVMTSVSATFHALSSGTQESPSET